MARSKTTTHHPEMRRSRRGAASASAAAVLPASTPSPALVASTPPSAPPVLTPSLAPSSSSPQPTAATSAVPSTAAIPTPVTSQVELDEDTGSENGTGSQSGSESEDRSGESPRTGNLEEEQQKSGSDFADENVEEEEESSNEEDDHLSAEESVPVRLSRAQKGKQKIDERSNVGDIPTEHQNVGHPSSDVPTSATHPQLFEQSLLRKVSGPGGKNSCIGSGFAVARLRFESLSLKISKPFKSALEYLGNPIRLGNKESRMFFFPWRPSSLTHDGIVGKDGTYTTTASPTANRDKPASPAKDEAKSATPKTPTPDASSSPKTPTPYASFATVLFPLAFSVGFFGEIWRV
ncbi:Uncharacterized protein Fot_08239 [Forsythia ovata]|uniref:Uncharacterized protein n=1 Tax=Forsythia ovata TaxID=205694 RepID=A0ABD1WYV3_9LAMI